MDKGRYCLWCFETEKLSQCGRCRNAYYCCKEHQIQHWRGGHKTICKPLQAPIPQPNLNLPTEDTAYVPENVQKPNNSGWTDSSSCAPTSAELVLPQNNQEHVVNLLDSNEKPVPDKALYSEAKVDNGYGDVSNEDCDEKVIYPFENDANLASLWSNDLFTISEDFWDAFTNGDSNISINGNEDCSSTENFDIIPTHQGNEARTEKSLQHVKLEDVCRNIISDLNEFGICVLDKFLGSDVGNCIESEVKSLFMKGIFTKGEVVNSEILRGNENIRGDLITWVSGNEPGCQQISNLIKKLDFVITACNKMPNNGILGEYNLNRRTKAMIACYPGDGTHYKKHVDNPHGDGRCITCIYYINKHYDRKSHGGVLRMFPVQKQKEVANIEPIFDRMIFFWSDRRNPHEVLPTYATRFAITVWYFDADERAKALHKYRMQNHS